MTQLVKPLRSGQITIPASFREKLGIDSDTVLWINLVEGELRIKPVRITAKAGDTDWFKKLYKQFAKVRKEAKSYTEKEINQAINKAVKTVRKSHVRSSY
ncbi:hypothetical protein A3I51_02995 [Candidatus Gottesmanbacteria bacterium RIFCSPLOWO2_02_FULL_38_8]|uniref:SpoVT-AbrB domain-containing protein n=1 Tax=Candidatus Gottesmanbacteria bacterium RIFCSPLOWO2_02_FULL_38_8 TaxID=1798397 RepID=A0A1F6B474_9BACT|nr:MAG: hypothetical protein A3I51_02995 [Candidatus Gottesmanbacteria bacterium RIFCSPLOWO2_02_FULL_38_8]